MSNYLIKMKNEIALCLRNLPMSLDKLILLLDCLFVYLEAVEQGKKN